MAAALICRANGLESIADEIVAFADARDWLSAVPTVTFGETYRPPATARFYAQAGIGIRNSLHTKKLAIDLNLFCDLDGDGDLDYAPLSEYHKPLGVWWEGVGSADFPTAWGGRFRRPDGNHYSVSDGGVK